MLCIIDESVIMLNPKYIGFLLKWYIPVFLKTVFSVGNPSLVDLPRYNELIMIKNRPINSNKYDRVVIE
jgi:hypothetical protein